MAKIEGSVYCKKCNSEIKWCHIFRQKLSSARVLEVDTIPDDVILLTVNPTENKVKVHCKNCDFVNEIESIGKA